MPAALPASYNGPMSGDASGTGLGWPVAGRLLEALSRRDFEALGTCLDPAVHFRALLPPTAVDVSGPAAVVSCFVRWFGGSDGYEVLDAEVGAMGPRLALRWRIRMCATAPPHEARVVEQHCFATVGERVEVLDLLCSGFVPERTVAAGGARAPEEAGRR
jgi:hypothetical protein